MDRRTALDAPIAIAAAALALAGCAYPRRGTPLSPVPDTAATTGAPSAVWALRVAGATVPPQRRGALSWDDSGGAPDPFVRLYRNDVLVWESPVAHDTFDPTWDVTIPENIYAPTDARLRFELWDQDEVGADPIGIFRHTGLPPNVVSDADARVVLEGGGQIALRLGPPRAHRGIGVRLYELRDDAMVVLEVETYSPAGRAGIAVGDQIVAIGGQAVSALGQQGAPGALSMAGERRQALRVRGADGQTREVELDHGFTWLTM